MPGLFGTTRWGTAAGSEPLETAFVAAQNALRHAPWQKTLFLSDPNDSCRYGIVEKDGCGQVHVHTSKQFDVIFYGIPERLSSETADSAYRPLCKEDAKALRSLAQTNDLDGLIAQTKGRASVLLHDREHRRLYLFSDPFGVFHIFLLATDRGLHFSSELKALYPFLDRIKCDADAIRSYVEFGLFPGSHTWFSDIAAMPPGALHRYDLDTGKASKSVSGFVDSLVEKRYGRQGPAPASASYDETIDRMHGVFAAAVSEIDARTSPAQELSLSGGRDSRALLAEIAPLGHLKATTTYGEAGCYERHLAESVSRAAGIPHRGIDVAERDWLGPRLAASWYIDGAIDIRNTHIIHCMPQGRPNAAAMWDGYFGDAIYGGKSPNYDRKKSYAELHVERGWKFTSYGPQIVRNWYDPLLPFVDMNLWSYAMDLPIEWTNGSKIYDAMLLRFYPALFSDIPVNSLGIPIGRPRLIEQARRKFMKGRIFLTRILQACSLDVRTSYETIPYTRWLTRRPPHRILKDDLAIERLLLPDILDLARDAKMSETPRSARELVRNIRMLSAEIYLQQICEDKLRPAPIGDR